MLISDTEFQPALPARGATPEQEYIVEQALISTRAPREGSDPMPSTIIGTSSDFNPRSPRGERLLWEV